MKTKIALLLSLLLGISITPATAAECTSSFYCYGNTANSVVRVVTRPPPIPPPNPRVVQQRRQAQLALRNRPTTTPRIAARPAQPVIQPRAATPAPARPAPRVNNPPSPTVRAPAPVILGNCQSRNDRAAYLESQAVLASKAGDRNNSVRLFREAANVRQQACR